jgi:hypothetical protein
MIAQLDADSAPVPLATPRPAPIEEMSR